MSQLKGESILLLKVKPGEMHKAVNDLERSEEINEVDPVLGFYDIVASGAFDDSRDLTDFIERVESKPFFQSCYARPSYESWKRRTKGDSRDQGWVLIRSSTPSATLRELKKLPNIQKLVFTSGDFNIVANFGVRGRGDWKRTVFKDIHGAAGVKEAITLLGMSD
ncbi:MAG: hypothetical protein LN417_05460 [Candidatus Thermoplasmatota archaeon]|nr:hypothetical protein [Candidatus Thermoplasmatota archaeon]